jgi:erythromycin esterase
MASSWITLSRYALGAILLASSVIAQSDEDPFRKWAAVHALPVATLESGGDFSDLRPLRSLVGNARVVALGEPTHGAHEPLAFRNRLIRFLVEQMGFTAIALESGFPESWTVDSFVGGGPGDADGVTRDGLSNGFDRFVENRELIQWMRDYNAAAPSAHHRKIRFYGIDLTAGGRVSGPRRSIDFALAFLARANPAEAERIRASLAAVLPQPDDDHFGSLTQPQLAALESSVPAIAAVMATNRASLIAHSSAEEYRWALHNLDVVGQLAKHFHVTVPSAAMRDAGPAIMARDRAMAENVQWALENEGPGGRILVFAHNNHVMNWTEDGGIWAGVREKPLMMGALLRRAYGTDLVIIATSSAGASAGLPRPEPIQDSIDSALARVGHATMVLDLRPARRSAAVFAWLSRQRPIHANISTHDLITPSTAADAFFFVEGLTPALTK